MEKEPLGNNTVTIADLLKIDREESDRLKVLEILGKNISTEEKIKEISALDKKNREKKVHKRSNSFVNSTLDPQVKSYINQIKYDIIENYANFEKIPSAVYILIIDDLTYITKTIGHLLENENYSVHTAKNGVEGLILFQTVMPDLVITDIRLPDINGFEIASLIRKINKTVPILFISAIAPDMKCYNTVEGAKAFIQKPVKKEHLLEVIQKHLKKT